MSKPINLWWAAAFVLATPPACTAGSDASTSLGANVDASTGPATHVDAGTSAGTHVDASTSVGTQVDASASAAVDAMTNDEDMPPPGTPPPVSLGDGMAPGVPQAGGGAVYYCKDALLGGFDWFDKLKGWFPSVLHSGAALTPTHQVVDMAYAKPGTMTFRNVVVPTDGTYAITFHYAYASGLFPGVTDRPEGLSVNGAVVTRELHFAITGSFDDYRDSSIQVTLAAGQNVIQVFNVTDHGVARFDTMTVVAAP